MSYLPSLSSEEDTFLFYLQKLRTFWVGEDVRGCTTSTLDRLKSSSLLVVGRSLTQHFQNKQSERNEPGHLSVLSPGESEITSITVRLLSIDRMRVGDQPNPKTSPESHLDHWPTVASSVAQRLSIRSGHGLAVGRPTLILFEMNLYF